MIALGMLNVALDVTTEQALDALRAHAYAVDSTVDALAYSIIDQQMMLDSLQSSSNS